MYDISEGDLLIPVHDLEGPRGSQTGDERGDGALSASPGGAVGAGDGSLDVDRHLRRHAESDAHLVQSEQRQITFIFHYELS